MIDSPLVIIRSFGNDIDAQLAHSALEAAGIDSVVRTDDCGGMRPHLQLSGVDILVREGDQEEAVRVLSTAVG